MAERSCRRLHLALGGLLGLAGVLLILGLTAHEAEASHFRGGSIYQFSDTTAGPNGVRMEGSLYFRLTYSSYATYMPLMVGDVLPASVFGGWGGMCAGYYGRVFVVNAPEDWFGVHISDGTNDFVQCNYGSSGQHTVNWFGSARLEEGGTSGPLDHHINNPNTAYQLRSVFTNGNNPPFTPDFPPIWYCAQNAVCWIPLDPIDPDGQPVSTRWSTSVEFGATYYPPGPCPGAAPTSLIGGCGPMPPSTTPIDSAVILSNNTIRWDTTDITVYPGAPVVRTFYSAQVMLYDDNGAWTPLEFLISIGPPRTEPPPPPLECSPASTSTTVGTQYTFGATGGVQPYSWSAPGGTPNGGSGSQFTTQYAAAGAYTVTVTDSAGDAATCQIQVDDPPVNCFPAWQTVDPLRYAFFYANGGMTGAYGWDAPSGAPAQGSGSYFSTAFAAPGTYAVTVSSGNQDATCTVEVPQPPPGPPSALFVAAAGAGCSEWPVQFQDTSTGSAAPIASWWWEFGDGATSVQEDPAHTYTAAGTYQVTLTVTDANGRSASATRDLTLLPSGCRASAQPSDEAGRPPGAPRDGRDAALAGRDSDSDGRGDGEDICPYVADAGQEDLDRDGRGDACDADRDGDLLPNAADNCPDLANPGQSDLDGEGLGDDCDSDRDGDTVPDAEDNCPATENLPQADGDDDGVGDACGDAALAALGPANVAPAGAIPDRGAEALAVREASGPASLGSAAGIGLGALAAVGLGLVCLVAARRRRA